MMMMMMMIKQSYCWTLCCVSMCRMIPWESYDRSARPKPSSQNGVCMCGSSTSIASMVLQLLYLLCSSGLQLRVAQMSQLMWCLSCHVDRTSCKHSTHALAPHHVDVLAPRPITVDNSC
jgi:hypothetical protein